MTAQTYSEQWMASRVPLKIATNWTDEQSLLVADLGYDLTEHGLTEEAITIFEGLLALDPTLAWVNSTLGTLWLRAGDLDRARDYLQRALEIDPSNLLALVNRGEVSFLQNDWELATLYLSAAIDIADELNAASSVNSCDSSAVSAVAHATRLLNLIDCAADRVKARQ